MDLGSGIQKNLFRISDPGVKKAPDPGSRSATLPESNSTMKNKEAGEKVFLKLWKDGLTPLVIFFLALDVEFPLYLVLLRQQPKQKKI